MGNETLIAQRMQRLLCLRLADQPAHDLIVAVARIWSEQLARFSPQRLSIAFDVVERTADRWPTPATIIAALPHYEHPYQPKPAPAERQIAVDPAQAAKSQARVRDLIDQCARSLGVSLEKGAAAAVRAQAEEL